MLSSSEYNLLEIPFPQSLDREGIGAGKNCFENTVTHQGRKVADKCLVLLNRGLPLQPN